MEEATFNIFFVGRAYQTDDKYGVKHMTHYEHQLRGAANKKLISYENASDIMNRYISILYNLECRKIDYSNVSDDKLSFIPFYGGLPPNASVENGIETRGEGHSRLHPDQKAVMCMATLCSCLKYFGHAVITVQSAADEKLIKQSVCILILI